MPMPIFEAEHIADSICEKIEYAVAEAKNDTAEIVSYLREIRDQLASRHGHVYPLPLAGDDPPEMTYGEYKPAASRFTHVTFSPDGKVEMSTSDDRDEPAERKESIADRVEAFTKACEDDPQGVLLESHSSPLAVFIGGVFAGEILGVLICLFALWMAN